MIKNLVLNNFGKFGEEKRFELSPVTVFYGKNESGKTTVFDGLFYAFCQPRGNTRYGRMLSDRYGDAATAGVEPSASLDADEFINLYAIRGGDIDIPNTDGNAEWLQRVTDSLFTGGINPKNIVDRLEELSGGGKKRKVKESIEKLATDIKDYEEQLEKEKKRRASILERQKDVEALMVEELQYNERLEKINQDIEGKRKEIIKEDNIRKRVKFKQQLDEINKYLGYKERLKALSAFENNRIEELDNLEKVRKDLETDKASLQGRKVELQRSEETKSKELHSLKSKAPSLRTKAEAAEKFLSEANSFKPSLMLKTVWNMGMVVGGILAFIFTIVIALILSDAVTRLIVMGGGLLIAIILLFLAKKVESVSDESAEVKFLKPLKEKWSVQFPEDNIMVLNTMTGFKSQIQSFINNYNMAGREQEKTEGGLGEIKKDIEDIGRKIGKNEEEWKKINEKIENWFKDKGVKNRDEYQDKIREVGKILQDIEKIKSKWQEEGIEPEKIETIKRVCRDKLEDFDREGIPEKGRNEEEYHRLKENLEKLQKDKDNIEKQVKDLTSKKEGSAGEIRGTLSGLPEEIKKLEEKVLELQLESKEKEVDKKAAALACEIFNEIQQDAGMRFEGLKEDIIKMLSVIVPEERDVAVESPDVKTFKMKDAAGDYRRVDMLSSGTRDALVFAAKLTLAKKTSDNFKILVLDEPFLHFDYERADNSIKLLKKFFEDWQIILFTKDDRIRDMVGKDFVDAIKVYDLDNQG